MATHAVLPPRLLSGPKNSNQGCLSSPSSKPRHPFLFSPLGFVVFRGRRIPAERHSSSSPAPSKTSRRRRPLLPRRQDDAYAVRASTSPELLPNHRAASDPISPPPSSSPRPFRSRRQATKVSTVISGVSSFIWYPLPPAKRRRSPVPWNPCGAPVRHRRGRHRGATSVPPQRHVRPNDHVSATWLPNQRLRQRTRTPPVTVLCTGSAVDL